MDSFFSTYDSLAMTCNVTKNLLLFRLKQFPDLYLL